jgi:NAD(P)H dehydrogenase (quinone)
MNHLIISTHFNPESFTQAIVKTIIDKSEKAGEEVHHIDLYAENFDPVLSLNDVNWMYQGGEKPEEIIRYQEMIQKADKITVVYPIWWAQMPAILKGFIDRVFSMGFAFLYSEEGPEPLLKGKEAHIITCSGSPNEYYEAIGMHQAIEKTIDHGVFEFCGFTTKHTFFGNVMMGSQELRESYLESLK